jgi:hypothetical protein
MLLRLMKMRGLRGHRKLSRNLSHRQSSPVRAITNELFQLYQNSLKMYER